MPKLQKRALDGFFFQISKQVIFIAIGWKGVGFLAIVFGFLAIVLLRPDVIYCDWPFLSFVGG